MSRESISSIKPATETVSGILQRKCDCGKPASPIGEKCEDCREQAGLGLQARLTIGASDDPLELEADRAAAAVMQMRSPGIRNQAASPPALSRYQAGSGDAGASRVPTSVTQTLQAPGEPLAPATRAFFEPRFGRDLSRVRIHRDASAAASARAVSAQAYTVGNRIAFGAGRYQPESEPGRELLAHELAHTIQQQGGNAQTLARRGGTAEGFFNNIGRAIEDFFTGSESAYDDAVLLEYLREIDRISAIQDDFDSDNKARAAVARWRSGNTDFALSARIKTLLIREMLEDYTGDADEIAILELLQNSPDSELATIFREVGIDNLRDDFHGEESDTLDRLLRGYQQRRQAGNATTEAVLPEVTNIPDTGIDRSLMAYLRQLDVADQPVKNANSHRLARAVVERWASGDERYYLPPRRKQLLIAELLNGTVSAEDQQQALNLMRDRDTTRAENDLRRIERFPGQAWISEQLTEDGRAQYAQLRQQMQDRAAASDALRRPNDRIERIVVDQEIPQTVTLHWRSGATDSDVCSTGKGHCCVDENDAQGAACSATESTQSGSNCTPVGTHRVAFTLPLSANVPPYWTEFYNSRDIALHQYSPVDGTPLSHGCVRLHQDTARKIHENVVIGGTQVIVRGLARPRCNWPGLQAEWSGDFRSANQTVTDGEPVAVLNRQRRSIDRQRATSREILDVDEAGLNQRLEHYEEETGGIPNANQLVFGEKRSAAFASIQSIIDDIPRCVPTQTVEERRLQTHAEPAVILQTSGFQRFAPALEQQLRRAVNYARAETLVRQQGEALWQAALTRARASGANPPADTDDRPLYWARLQMTGVLRNWSPRWLRQSPGSSRTGTIDDIRRDKTRLLAIFERASRGMESAQFNTQPGQKRILISGFDPFGLHDFINRGNPSGAAILALDNQPISNTAGSSAQLQGVIFPVRFADFNAGMVEQFFRPFISGPNRPDMIMTISQGSGFEVEQYAGRRRSSGPYPDNQGLTSGGTLAQPVEAPGLGAGPEFTQTTLPATAIRAELGRNAPITEETEVTEIRAGETRPTNSSRGPTAGSTAVEGSGGGYLSNEIFYRTSLMRDQAGAQIPLGHLHTPAIDPTASASERAASRDAIVARIKTILQATIDEI